MEPTIAPVTDLSPSIVEPLASILAHGFNPSVDPISRVVYAGVDDPEGFCELRFRSRVYAAVRDLEVTVAKAQDQEGTAVMIVNPPGTLDNTPATTPYAAELAARTPPEVVRRRDLLVKSLEAFEKAAFGNDKYYLSFLCTSVNGRRKGLAGCLVRALLAQARAEGQGVGLTTQSDEHVKYYSTYGFRVVGDTTIDVEGSPMRFIAMVTE